MLSFPVLGRSLSAAVGSAELEAWIRAHWWFPEHAPEPYPYDIRVEELSGPPALEAGSREEVVQLHRVSLTCRVGDGVWTFGDETAGVRLRVGAEESRVLLWGTEGDGARVVLPALFLALNEAIRASGLVPLHGSVAVRDGEATVFAGRSGVGKSTTLFQAFRAGWEPLAEDFAWLDPASLVVYGWDRGLRLWPEARERFAPDLPAHLFRTDADGKLFLAYDALERPPARTGTLRRLALLERDEARPSAWEPLEPRDAVRAWWEAAGVPLHPGTRASLAREIAGLLTRTAASRLVLGAGPLPL